MVVMVSSVKPALDTLRQSAVVSNSLLRKNLLYMEGTCLVSSRVQGSDEGDSGLSVPVTDTEVPLAGEKALCFPCCPSGCKEKGSRYSAQADTGMQERLHRGRGSVSSL